MPKVQKQKLPGLLKDEAWNWHSFASITFVWLKGVPRPIQGMAIRKRGSLGPPKWQSTTIAVTCLLLESSLHSIPVRQFSVNRSIVSTSGWTSVPPKEEKVTLTLSDREFSECWNGYLLNRHLCLTSRWNIPLVTLFPFILLPFVHHSTQHSLTLY